MAFDFSITEKKSKEKPSEKIEGNPFQKNYSKEDPELMELRKLFVSLRKEFVAFKHTFRIKSERNSAEFVKFLRRKFNIQNMSKTDMRMIKKLPDLTMSYEEKQTMSGLIRHHGNLDLVLEWIEEFFSN